jgi:tetratricopeptide (TPR) repeat protein
MGSLIPGYEYDIFISYRQKDNKHDGWVTKFVENLKGEIEATFKEDISIYFDENPHDRLQETHDVDKSLEGKLKCLIFIPILSQTYCDPNSYAWQYEFLAFNRFTSNDRFGKDVKLRGGNVASRILPIRIHELEPEDVKLFEKETGNVMRAMDFVFKTASGVNRPLLPDDNKNDNLNKTLYRDQINKVANAIKEIIQGIKSESVPDEKERTIPKEPIESFRKEDNTEKQEKPIKPKRIKLLSGVLFVIILIIAAIIAFPKLFKHDTLDKLRSSGERISIAVMPFQNMTNDTIWNVWQDGIQNELINSLTNSKELRVQQSESIKSVINSKELTGYASITPSVASSISKKLNTDVFIYGSIKQAGTIIRLNAQLIDSKTAEAFKSFQIDGDGDDILFIIDSLSVMVRNFLIISVLEKEVPKDFHELVVTNSSEAYRYYMYGNQAFYKNDYPTASEWFFKALDIDSSFNEAIRMLAYSLSRQGIVNEAKIWCLKNYNKREQMPEQEKLWANILYAQFFETPYETIKYFKLLIAYNDEMPVPHSNLGYRYNELYLYDKAIPEFEKELEIYKKWGSKPRWVNSYIELGFAYHKMGMYKEERKLYKKAEKDFPDTPNLIFSQAILSFSEGDTITADRYIEKYISISKERSIPHAIIQTELGEIYSEAKVFDKAEEHYRQALSVEPNNSVMTNNLSYFLIDKDRNINEGMELVESALKLQPDNFTYLDTKGWGLYKQGKYQEALAIL